MFESRYDAVILAGGEGRRLGGADKALLDVGGRPLLEVVLAAVIASASRVVVVGPPRPGLGGVLWCRENPPGGGPVAGLAAALPQTTQPYLVVLATDLPFVTPAVVGRRVEASQGHDGALLVDSVGRDQLLCAAYARRALADRLAGRPAGGWAGRALHALVEGLDLLRLTDEESSAFDCDTWDDLALARRREADRAR